MSVVLFPSRSAPPFPAAAAQYYQTDRSAERVVRLRSLTAVEQMYAYWGSDRA
ncbi:MAG: hypothetical protein ACK4IU_16230 [Tabrizicola flagellatus]|jgi:hypothetical protein|uniref:hypothetical protein n=1 Tax=Tabrizicola flagellatus TaxID=2593021 RepID=UPI003919F7E5